eukprot:2100106-Pyramimonas_sp.AAC.1
MTPQYIMRMGTVCHTQVREDWSLRSFLERLYLDDGRVSMLTMSVRGFPIEPRSPLDMLMLQRQHFRLVIRLAALNDSDRLGAVDVVTVPEELYIVAADQEPLSNIALKYDVSTATLVRANLQRFPWLTIGCKLRKDQKLVIPRRDLVEFHADLWLGYRTEAAVEETWTQSSPPGFPKPYSRKSKVGGVHMYTRRR